MFSQSDADANKLLEAPPAYPGAPPDAERAKKPPLPEPPYEPYAKPSVHEPPYKPYAKKPSLPELPYEPYKGMQSQGDLSGKQEAVAMPKKKKRPLRKSVSRTSKMARSQNVPSKQQRDHNEGEHYSQTPTLFKASVDSEKAPRAKTRKAA